MAPHSICASCFRMMLRKEFQAQYAPRLLRPSITAAATRRFTISASSRSSPSSPPPRSLKPLTAAERESITNFASKIRNKGGALRSTTEPYVAYGSTEDLFRECAKQCDYTIPAVLKDPPELPPRNGADEHVGEGRGWWYLSKAQGGLGLDVTFNTWAQVLMLHMWMLTARLRAFPKENVRVWHQNLLDHFFYAAEDRMVVWHGLSARGTRNKYLKDLWLQWRGVILSYDEAVIKGDAVLASALWRNVFKAKEDVDFRDLALVAAYVRREMQMLDRLPDDQLAAGKMAFGLPESVNIKGLGQAASAVSPQN